MSNGVNFRKLSLDLRDQLNQVTAEREALQVRVNGLLEDFQELSEQSERRSRLASEFEDRMGCLQVENGKLRDRISLLGDSGEHVESHLERQADILRIERDALQQRLTKAEEELDLLQAQAVNDTEANTAIRAERDALQAELTKAREALREIICACGDERSHGYISMLAEDALSNQSAPADKGGDS